METNSESFFDTAFEVPVFCDWQEWIMQTKLIKKIMRFMNNDIYG
jgi:hypothetical protein